MGLIAILVLGLTLLRSLSPTWRSASLLPRFDVSGLGSGSHTYFEREGVGRIRPLSKYLVIRSPSSNLFVYEVPIRDGNFVLPDLHWWRWGIECKDFRPDTIDGKVTGDSVIRCQDSEVAEWSDWWRRELRWSIDGKNLGTRTEDMQVPKYVVEYNEIVLGKRQ